MSMSIEEFILENGDYKEILSKMVMYEEENQIENRTAERKEVDSYWDYSDVSEHPSRINKLVTEGIVRKIMDTNSTTLYSLRNRQACKDALESVSEKVNEDGVEEVEHDFPDPEDLPEQLFDEVIGYDDVKWLLERGLTTDSITNFLMVGPPGSAKTVFLLSIRDHIGDAAFITAQSTGPGFTDKLFEDKPKFMLIDELDDMDGTHQEALSSYTETGIVSETKHEKDRELKINTKTLASANVLSDIENHIKDRFTVLKFDAYTRDEFIEVCENVLPMKEDCDEEEANEIAKAVWEMDEQGNVRKAIQIARLSRGDPHKVVSVLKKYSEAENDLASMFGK